jgi:hypothetical protein
MPESWLHAAVIGQHQYSKPSVDEQHCCRSGVLTDRIASNTLPLATAAMAVLLQHTLFSPPPQQYWFGRHTWLMPQQIVPAG